MAMQHINAIQPPREPLHKHEYTSPDEVWSFIFTQHEKHMIKSEVMFARDAKHHPKGPVPNSEPQKHIVCTILTLEDEQNES